LASSISSLPGSWSLSRASNVRHSSTPSFAPQLSIYTLPSSSVDSEGLEAQMIGYSWLPWEGSYSHISLSSSIIPRPLRVGWLAGILRLVPLVLTATRKGGLYDNLN
jgi:hypothetical protein